MLTHRAILPVFFVAQLSLAIILCRPAAASAPELQGLFSAGEVWQQSGSQFMDAHQPLGFAWVSAAQDSARSVNPEITFGGLRVYEAVARFDKERMAGMTLLFFSRGDAGKLGQQKFDDLLKAAAVALNSYTGVKPVQRGRDASSVVKAEGVSWETESSRFLLEWSAVREVRSRDIPFRAEFIRLQILPPEQKAEWFNTRASSAGSPSTGQGLRTSIAQRISRTPDGDVMLQGVPMVDQGEKGYCVVATAERVLRYYGVDADQHELAQIANSSAQEGTSMEAMQNALKKLTNRFQLRTRARYEMDVRGFLQLVKDYNRGLGRARGSDHIDLSNTRVIDLNKIYSSMDPEVLKEVRAKDRAGMARFEKEIQQQINAGVPLLWSLMLGIVEEAPIPQASGGHMRLIIGYNTAKNELIYSDSWGIGHEVKRMAVADAWTGATGLLVLEPL